MKQLHQQYLEHFHSLKALYQKYGFSSVLEELDSDIANISDFKVTVPLVGGFSTGKSTLLNELIGYDFLSTDITPETAVPAELTYGQENVTICMKDGTEKTASLNTTGTQDIPAGCSLMKVQMQNPFFEQIPDIRLVDMPGFDSGIEVHNRAINDYLPKSLAYIIAIAADEGTVRASILNFLAELQLNNMPVYAVITKADKCDEEEIPGIAAHIKQTIEHKMHITDLKLAVTSADDGETEQMQEILKEIQAKSEEIFRSHYEKKLRHYAENLQSYLNKQLSAPNTNLIQVQEDKKLLEEKISDMKKDLADEKERFAEQADRCIEGIRSKVESELRSSSSVLENILMQGGSIQEKVNFLVRNAITAGIREQLEPKLQKYISNVSDLIRLGDIESNTGSVLLDQSVLEDNEKKRAAFQQVVTPVTTVIATVIGTVIGGPLGPVIGAAVGAVAGALLGGAINQHSREQEEAQRREAASQRVRQVIDEVMASVRTQIEATVHEMMGNVNQEIDKAVTVQIEMKQKELADLESSLSRSEQEQKEKIAGYQTDLAAIASMLE